MPFTALTQACLPLIIAIAALALLAAALVQRTFARSSASEGRHPTDAILPSSNHAYLAAAQHPCWHTNSRLTPAAHLLEIHRDTSGGVQSLAFVLTFPLLILIVLFIVQLSQLLIGVVTVHYAAFAAVRAASVWIPAVTADSTSIPAGRSTNANVLPPGAAAGVDFQLNSQTVDALGSRKAREIWSAAALACVSIAPSRNTTSQSTSSLANSAATALTAVVHALDAGAATNGRLPQRLANKTNYSFANTSIDLRFDDRSSTPAAGEFHTYNPISHPSVQHVPSEVGWQDPVRVTVRHKFALLPGPGRWLAKGIANSDGRILLEDGVSKTTLSATATMTVDGLQSLRPHTHAP